MTKYRIVECRCPDSTTFYVEYKGFWWNRVQEIDRSVSITNDWIAAKQAANAPCTTIIHQP